MSDELLKISLEVEDEGVGASLDVVAAKLESLGAQVGATGKATENVWRNFKEGTDSEHAALEEYFQSWKKVGEQSGFMTGEISKVWQSAREETNLASSSLVQVAQSGRGAADDVSRLWATSRQEAASLVSDVQSARQSVDSLRNTYAETGQAIQSAWQATKSAAADAENGLQQVKNQAHLLQSALEGIGGAALKAGGLVGDGFASARRFAGDAALETLKVGHALGSIGVDALKSLPSIDSLWKSTSSGAEKVIKDAHAASSGLHAIGGAAEAAVPGVDAFGGAVKSAFMEIGLIVGAVVMVKDALSGMFGELTGGNAEMENARVRFTQLDKSVDAADQSIRKLTTEGLREPFVLPGLIDMDIQLKNFGLDSENTSAKFHHSGDEIRGTVENMGAAFNHGSEGLKEIADNLGKFASTGMAGPITALERMGLVTRQEMAGMGIEFSKAGHIVTPLNEAMDKLLTGLGTKFQGLSDMSMMTWSGMSSNLQDYKQMVLREFGSGIFDEAKGAMASLLQALPSADTIHAWAAGFGKAITFIVDVSKAVQSELGSIWQSIIGPIQWVEEQALGWGQSIMTQLTNGMLNGFGPLGDVISQIASYLEEWLMPHSPPKVAPWIDVAGKGTMQAYYDGMKTADGAKVFTEISGQLTSMINSLVDGGKSSKVDAITMILGDRDALAQAMAELDRTGKVSEEAFAKIRSAAGAAGPQVEQYARAAISAAEANKQLADAQKTVTDISKKYDDEIKDQEASLKNVELQAKKSGDELAASLQKPKGELIEVNEKIRDNGRALADSLAGPKKELSDIGEQLKANGDKLAESLQKPKAELDQVKAKIQDLKDGLQDSLGDLPDKLSETNGKMSELAESTARAVDPLKQEVQSLDMENKKIDLLRQEQQIKDEIAGKGDFANTARERELQLRKDQTELSKIDIQANEKILTIQKELASNKLDENQRKLKEIELSQVGADAEEQKLRLQDKIRKDQQAIEGTGVEADKQMKLENTAKKMDLEDQIRLKEQSAKKEMDGLKETAEGYKEQIKAKTDANKEEIHAQELKAHGIERDIHGQETAAKRANLSAEERKHALEEEIKQAEEKAQAGNKQYLDRKAQLEEEIKAKEEAGKAEQERAKLAEDALKRNIEATKTARDAELEGAQKALSLAKDKYKQEEDHLKTLQEQNKVIAENNKLVEERAKLIEQEHQATIKAAAAQAKHAAAGKGHHAGGGLKMPKLPHGGGLMKIDPEAVKGLSKEEIEKATGKKSEPDHSLFKSLTEEVNKAHEAINSLGAGKDMIVSAWGTGGVAGVFNLVTGALGNWTDQAMTAMGQFAGPLAEKALGWANSLWTWVIDATPKVIAQLEAWGVSLWGWLTDKAANLYEAMKPYGVALWNWIVTEGGKATDKLGEWGAQLWGWAKDKAGLLADSFGPWADSLTSWLDPKNNSVTSKLAEWGGQVWGWIASSAGKLGEQFLSWASEFGAWLVPAVTKFLQEWPAQFGAMLNSIHDSVAPVLGKIADWLGEHLPDILAGIGGVVAGISVFLGETVGVLARKLYDWGTEFVNWIAPRIPGVLAELGSLKDRLGDWLDGTALPWLKEHLSLWGAAAWQWIKDATPVVLDTLGGWKDSFAAWFTGTALPWLVEHLKSWGTALWNWIVEVTPVVLSKIGGWWVEFSGWFAFTALPWLVKHLIEWQNAMIDWIILAGPKVLIQLAAWSNDLQNWFVFTALPWLVNHLLEWGKALWRWIPDAWSDVEKELGFFGGKILKWVDDNVQGIKDKATSIGLNLILGIVEGLASEWHRVVNWLADKAALLPEPLQKALKINSPSEVFADTMKWVPLGMVDGLNATMPEVHKALDLHSAAIASRAVVGGLDLKDKYSQILGTPTRDAMVDGLDLVGKGMHAWFDTATPAFVTRAQTLGEMVNKALKDGMLSGGAATPTLGSAPVPGASGIDNIVSSQLPANAAAILGSIGSSQQGTQAPGAGSVTNNYTINIPNIVINTAATDGQGVATDLVASIKSRFTALRI